MTGSWLVVKWVFGAVWAAYFILQIAAIRSLHGETRSRCLAVLRFMVVAMLLANGLRLIFDSHVANRVGLTILSGLGMGAIFVLSRLFRLERNAVLRADS